jgi:hypothetical protein
MINIDDMINIDFVRVLLKDDAAVIIKEQKEQCSSNEAQKR